jgi:DnaJ-class molecular chaperone
MDPILNRLGRLIRSLATDRIDSRLSPDPDLRQAEEELDEFLRTGADRLNPSGQSNQSFHQRSKQDSAPASAPLDGKLVSAYAILGLTPSASWDDVTAVHRSLLKKHHPDRHAGHEANMRKATAQSQKIGEAFQKIKKHLGH